MTTLKGSCLCGKVKLEVPDDFEYAGNCHCRECRKFSGSAFASAGAIATHKIVLTAGKEIISYYKKGDNAELAFCSQCGCSLFSTKLKENICYIRYGILDMEPTCKPGFHIFTAYKASWFEITDDLPQYDEMP